ncbi:hypothetical protein ES708_25635 [subsurface metagenome]
MGSASLYPASSQSTLSSSQSHSLSSHPVSEHVDHGFSFMGMGEQTNDFCGKIRSMIACPECHYYVPIRIRCKRSTCPVCFHSLIGRGAESAQSRIMGYYNAQLADNPAGGSRRGRVRLPYHAVLSLPEDQYCPSYVSEKEEMKRLKDIFRKQALKMGSTGGTSVIHVFRIKWGYKRLLNELATRLNKSGERTPSGGRYKLYDALRTLPNWRECVYYSPHVHIIGYGYLQPSNELEDGWVYKKIINRPLKDGEDVRHLISYLLSHATPVSGMHTVTYFGVCSYNKLVIVDKQYFHEPVLCPNGCSCELVYADMDGIPYPHMETYLRMRVIITYRMAGEPPSK